MNRKELMEEWKQKQMSEGEEKVNMDYGVKGMKWHEHKGTTESEGSTPKAKGGSVKSRLASVPKGKSLNVGDWSFQDMGDGKVKMYTAHTERTLSMEEADKYLKHAESQWGEAKIGNPNIYYDL